MMTGSEKKFKCASTNEIRIHELIAMLVMSRPLLESLGHHLTWGSDLQSLVSIYLYGILIQLSEPLVSLRVKLKYFSFKFLSDQANLDVRIIGYHRF